MSLKKRGGGGTSDLFEKVLQLAIKLDLAKQMLKLIYSLPLNNSLKLSMSSIVNRIQKT